MPSNPQTSTGKTVSVKRNLQRAIGYFLQLTDRRPHYVLSGMLICLISSGILAFTVMRTDGSHTLPILPKPQMSTTVDKLTEAMSIYGALQSISAIQDTISAIINKKTLDNTDSIRLTNALKRFEQLQKSIYHQNRRP